MSGHSKWTQIKHQKATADKKRGKLFSILTKRIAIAARSDKNPESNPVLKVAIEKAREKNLSKDTIERAIKRGAGELPGAGPIEEVVYEAYGQGGAQIVVVASTDNKNRTTGNIRHILTKYNGSMSGTGSVLWNFARKGGLFYPKTKQPTDQKLAELIAELIAALEEDDDVDEVFTNL